MYILGILALGIRIQLLGRYKHIYICVNIKDLDPYGFLEEKGRVKKMQTIMICHCGLVVMPSTRTTGRIHVSIPWITLLASRHK